mmetsp:Transcript_23141/g.55373  ORF Transcript_23141/g.55373 Transcript_23141/m.55373 type:complete len:212 (-) Transcript_23141:731-1366(-)
MQMGRGLLRTLGGAWMDRLHDSLGHTLSIRLHGLADHDRGKRGGVGVQRPLPEMPRWRKLVAASSSRTTKAPRPSAVLITPSSGESLQTSMPMHLPGRRALVSLSWFHPDTSLMLVMCSALSSAMLVKRNLHSLLASCANGSASLAWLGGNRSHAYASNDAFLSLRVTRGTSSLRASDSQRSPSESRNRLSEVASSGRKLQLPGLGVKSYT